MIILKNRKKAGLELDSVTPFEQAWLGSGCLLTTMGGLVMLAILGAGAEASPLRWFLLGGMGAVALGLGMLLLSFWLEESYLLDPGGVRLRRCWFGFEQRRWLAPSAQIQCLALDGSERGPSNWRLLLVRLDGKTHELAGYSFLEEEEQRWQESVARATEVAAALNTSLRLPEGIERGRRLQVGPNGAIEYVEFLEFSKAETKSLIGTAVFLFLMFLTIIGAAFWLRSQGMM